MEVSKRRSRTHGVPLLPEDIIFDILVRLPVKALCQFQCVCKAWRTLISDPSFIAAQRSHAGPLIVGMFRSSSRPRQERYYELRVLDTNGVVLRVFEVNEIACLAPTRLDLICVDRTVSWLGLGAMIVDPAARRAFTVGRDIDDDKAYWSSFSFGRATPSGTYKLLRLYGTTETEAMVSEVATITDDGVEPTWRQRPTPDLLPCYCTEQKATVNGVVYFMPYLDEPTTSPDWSRVAAFDLESEAWMETIDGPPLGLEVEPEEWDIALTDLKGTLCMVQNITVRPDYVDDRCLVWRLMDYKKSVWVKAYTIRMPAEYFHLQVLDVLDDGRIMLLNCCESGYILQLFSPCSEAFKDIMKMAEGFIQMTFYTGSLLSSKPVLNP